MEDEFLKELYKMRVEIMAVIEANTDPRRKEVGDRVIIWDWSFCKDTNGKSHNCFTGYEEVPGIVIEVDLKFKSEDFLGEPQNLDTLVAYPDGTKIYTKQEFIKLCA